MMSRRDRSDNMTPRPLLALHRAERDDIADLVTRRPLPNQRLDQLDPFLFLNHHGPQTYPPGNRGLPFGPHPHRGFETVTFILAGNLMHRDTCGHESVIEAGGVQWMTAGSGLIHAELSPDAFKRSGGPLEILQLWLNLPARLKMSPPAYRGLQREEIPSFAPADGVRLDLISGSFAGHQGAISSLTGVAMATVELAAGSATRLEAASGRTIFFYLVRGRVEAGGAEVPQHHLAQFGDGDAIDVRASEDSLILFGHADPIGEPVVAHGPFVMNSRAEIMQAVADYQAGKFGRM